MRVALRSGMLRYLLTKGMIIKQRMKYRELVHSGADAEFQATVSDCAAHYYYSNSDASQYRRGVRLHSPR